MDKDRREQHEGLKLLTEEISRFSHESGEKPSVLMKWDEEEIVCHRSLLRSKCPELLEKIEEGYCLDEDMEQELNHNMISVLYFVYTDVVKFWNEHKFGLVCVAISYDLIELANEASKIVLDDNWTCITGLHAGMCVTNRCHMDGKFTQDIVCINLQKIPHDFVPLDLWDFKGKSLSTEVTPRQLVMVDKKVNVLEFDNDTLRLIEKPGIEKQKFVKIDFEVDNIENKRGVVLSSMTRGPQSFRIKMVFPKSKDVGAVGVYLLAAGVRGFCSQSVSGNLILVNQLDRKKDIVKEITTTLSDTVSDWGYREMFSMDDITDPSKGFVKDGVIICKARVLVDGHRVATYRYTQIMERRKKKLDKSDALGGTQKDKKDKKEKTKHVDTKLTDEKAHPLCKNSKHDNSIQEDGNIGDTGKAMNTLDAGKKYESSDMPKHHKDIAESVVDEVITKAIIEEDLMQELCQSLPPEGEKENCSTEELDVPVEEVKKKRKKRKPKDKCSLPTCNSHARHRCSRCLEVRFCSQECSNQHWAVHREQCNLIREMKERDREEIMD